MDGTIRTWEPATGRTLTISAAVGDSWATWTEGPHPELLSAGGNTWRWLRVRVFDGQGRFVSQDPYEWYFPTAGTGGTGGPTGGSRDATVPPR